MSADWKSYYFARIQGAKAEYQKDRDRGKYFGVCLYYALMTAADEAAASNPRLKHLPTGLLASSYAIKSLVITIDRKLSCPIDSDDDHIDFLSSWKEHGLHLVKSDLSHVRDVLTHVGL
ncbi:hypothetical protein [Roseateles sp. P5_E11]